MTCAIVFQLCPLDGTRKDVRANCFCASLLRTQIHTSCISRALNNKISNDGQMAIAIALLGFNDLGRSVTPTFLAEQITFTIISTLSKNEQKINVGS